jgi:hypothetical protein
MTTVIWRNAETREESVQRPGDPVFVESQTVTQAGSGSTVIISYRPFEFAF